MQVSPWKTRHGNVKATWKKVMDGILLEKFEDSFIFVCINIRVNPKFVDTYIVHEKNYKDEILICHLMQVSPWKARHGNVKAAWKKVMDGILLEKFEGSFIFVVSTLAPSGTDTKMCILHLVINGEKKEYNERSRKLQKMKNLTTVKNEQPNS